VCTARRPRSSTASAAVRQLPPWSSSAAQCSGATVKFGHYQRSWRPLPGGSGRRDLLKNLPPMDGASLALRHLWAQEGIRIRIITFRLYFEFFHAVAVSQTIEWLDQHDFPYWDLCFMKDKAAVGADLYIEDSVSNVKALRAAAKKVIAFATPQNGELGPDRAQDWHEVEERASGLSGRLPGRARVDSRAG
jgi:5' nucleotidase, deoxy (Pyrimidine), cytosolic type C protein (NT5C)